MKDSNKTKDQLIKELTELRQQITKLERSKIESNLYEVFDALKKISSGDPTVRIEETSEIDFVSQLKHMVNLTAENIGEIVDLSHEFAMVLAELFDVLHQVSKGNFNARVSGSSQIELLESLKKLTNDMIGSISREITERKQMENVLHEREERYRELFETVTDAVLVHYVSHEKPGKFIAVNESACNLFGYTADEFLQMEINNIDVPEQVEKVPAILEKLFRDGHTLFETEHVTKDRKRIPVEVNVRLFDFHGKPAVLSVVRDITERKKAEEENKMLSSVVQQSTEGTAIADLDGKLIFVNDAWCKMHGYNRPEELLGKNLAISHNQEQIENDVKPFNKKVMELGAYSGEVGHITKDGKPFPTLMVTTLLKDKQGKPYALAGIAKDITESKRAELQIRESEKRYRELYEGSRDGYAMVNMEGTIIESNNSFKEMLGYTNEELLIKTYKDITPLKWHPIEAKIIEEQVMKRGYSDIYEKEYIRKNGTVLPVEIRTHLLKEEDGKPKAMWAFISDITERRHAEEEIQKRVKELEEFYDMAVGRELRMVALKKEIEHLKQQLEEHGILIP